MTGCPSVPPAPSGGLEHCPAAHLSPVSTFRAVQRRYAGARDVQRAAQCAGSTAAGREAKGFGAPVCLCCDCVSACACWCLAATRRSAHVKQPGVGCHAVGRGGGFVVVWLTCQACVSVDLGGGWQRVALPSSLGSVSIGQGSHRCLAARVLGVSCTAPLDVGGTGERPLCCRM